ncbi:MAG TPA: hypothetical protein VGB13_10400 [Candidatus Krumholzibacteria bacterium]|jgi:hypothetical protein
MRRYAWIALFALTPLTAYECVEKCAEHLPMSGGLYSLSLQAEHDTRWTLRGHGNVFDRARHELAESRRFYLLAGFQLIDHISG